jgi:hypothetical protein
VKSIDMIYRALAEARRWRDQLWVTILEDLESRDPRAVASARAAMNADNVRAMHGASTHAAALAWPHLDNQARMEWVWVCEFVQRTWIRGMAPEEDDTTGIKC